MYFCKLVKESNLVIAQCRVQSSYDSFQDLLSCNFFSSILSYSRLFSWFMPYRITSAQLMIEDLMGFCSKMYKQIAIGKNGWFSFSSYIEDQLPIIV